MNNSISDWNVIDSKQMILENILNTNKKLDLILEKFDKYDTKLNNLDNKITIINESLKQLKNNSNKLENNLDFNNLNNFKQQNNGLKELVNSDLSRIKNNIWRQSTKNNLKNNSYITTPNIPLDFNFQ